MAVATHVMKKFINDPADIVKESLAGLAAAHPDLVRVDFENQIVVRKDAPFIRFLGVGETVNVLTTGAVVGRGRQLKGRLRTFDVHVDHRLNAAFAESGAAQNHRPLVVLQSTGDDFRC